MRPPHYTDLGGGHHKRRDPDKVRKHAFRRSPCGRPPVAPTGLVGEFDRAESGRHTRIRCKVRWNEVVRDTTDFPILIRNYIVELDYTANGSDWFQARRATVSAKDDVDPSNKAHHIFKSVAKNLGYRFRVRAVARDGCKSNWSDWLVIGNPGTDEPPAPQNVTIVDNDKHLRVTLRWDEATAADDPNDLFDDRVNHFVVEISKQVNFGSVYMKDRAVKGQHKSFRINNADENDTFYGRVRSVSSDKDKSAWIPAKLNGNSDPGATADGVTVGKAMEKTKKPKVPTGLSLTFSSDTDNSRGERWKAKILWNEVTQDINNVDIDIGHYVVLFQKSDDGTTWSTDPRKFVVNAKDADADTTCYQIVHNINGKKFYRAKVRAVSESSTRGDFTSYTGDSQSPGSLAVPTPTDVTIHHKTRGKDRVVVDWDAPVDPGDADLPDERVHFFQVVVKKNSTVTPTTIASGYRFDRKVMATKQSFRVPRADEDELFSAWVRAIDDSGNKSSWIPATTAGNNSAGATASQINTDDGVKVGAIRKWSGRIADGIPQGYLLCNGQSVSTATYPDLFAVIDYRYGGSGSNFNVPDHRKRQARGAGTAQNEGDTEGLAEGSRDEDHGKHNQATHKKHKDHRHKHHHRHKKRHTEQEHHVNSGDGQHHHFIASANTGFDGTNWNTNTSSSGSASGGSGTPTDLTRVGHTHGMTARNTNDGGVHVHTVQGGDILFGGGSTGNPGDAHIEHREIETLPDGPANLFSDSYSGGTMSASHASVVDRNVTWTGEPTTNTGAVTTVDDVDAPASVLGSGNAGHGDHPLPDDDDGVRGHKKHPFIRFHYIIKAT